jgi:tetratricopeptide (TPR) repeat protein
MFFSLFLLSLVPLCALCFHVDPSEFFTGSKPVPRMEIEKPNNGDVLEDSMLEIRLSIKGYTFPSPLHDCSICIGLSQGSNFAEECFDQTEVLTFHVDGLLPGAQYALRVVLFERRKAIAVSVRNFRVGGIFGLLDNNEQAVTVKTAIQLAIQHQSGGSHALAEKIYRQVLQESPSHPDALHLIGLTFYQRGDPSSAIPYIERALSTNKTFEGFHNSLGECFRVVGRYEEAKSQFELALALNPTYPSAAFNLGLTYQVTSSLTWNQHNMTRHENCHRLPCSTRRLSSSTRK